MGFWDNGPKDTSTPDQRKGWRTRAEEQIAEQNGDREQDQQTDPQHRRARRPGQ